MSRILRHKLFADSPRMARFLAFAVDETLQGRAKHLKENVVGIHVFDRSPEYDPRIDPIVRVEARRLREKLCAYYERDGRSDELVLELPKGGYALAFRRRSGVGSTDPVQTDSIAVLPFTNLSGETGTDFLTDGLTEDLIGALTRVSRLRVSAWTSASRIKSDQDDIDTIRELLGVSFIVRGSIRKQGDRIRILSHLIETSSKRYIWSQTFDRQFKDIFAIQDEITGAIVDALRAQISSDDSNTAGSSGRAYNLDAYQLCLKGRFHARERTLEGLQRSEVCFRQAIQLDPTSVSAHSGLADTYTLQAEYGLADAPESIGKAKRAVEQALSLDPASAEALASYGLILVIYDWAWDRAEAMFLRALDLNDNYAPAHHWYALNHLAMLGRYQEAENEVEATVKLDPLSPVVKTDRAFLRFLQRRYQESIDLYNEVIGSDPSFYKAYTSAGRSYVHMGRYDRAIEMLEKAMTIAGEVPSLLGVLGQANGLAGNRTTASQLLERLMQLATTRPVFSTSIALIHLGLGEEEKALDWLERGVNRSECNVNSFAVHPAYDQLRGHTRFEALVKRVVPGYRPE